MAVTKFVTQVHHKLQTHWRGLVIALGFEADG